MATSVQNIMDEAKRGTAETWYYRLHDFETTLDTNVWATVKDASASAAISTGATLGSLLLSSAATTNDDGALVQSVQNFIAPTSGKRIALRIKVKASDADQQDFFAGLALKGATDPEATLAVASRIGFQINDGDASILCKTTSTTETSVDSQQDMADDTYVTLGLCYDGSRVQFEVNGNAVAVHTTNIPTAAMAIAMFHLSGDNSGTHTSTWEYVEVAVER